MFGDAGPGCFPEDGDFGYVIAYLNTKPTELFLSVMNPTINLSSGVTALLPFIMRSEAKDEATVLSEQCIHLSKADWDSFETSWDFKKHPMI